MYFSLLPFVGVRLPGVGVAILDDELEGGREGADPVAHVLGLVGQDDVDRALHVVLQPRAVDLGHDLEGTEWIGGNLPENMRPMGSPDEDLL